MDQALCPKISIIIPVYNAEDFLMECLDSVLQQEEKRIEVICINDGSTDGSAKILAEYEQKDDRIVVITQENTGLSATRNRGVSAANGEYIQFLDSDDKLRKGALKNLLTQAQEQALDILYFEGDTFFEESFSDREGFKRYEGMYRAKAQLPEGVFTGSELFAMLNEIKSYRSSACMQFIRRAFLLECGITFLKGIYYEDNIFTLKTMTQAQRVAYRPEALYLRRMRENSIVTSAKGYNHYRSYVIAFAEMSQYVFSADLPQSVMPGVRAQLQSLLNHASAVFSELTPEQKRQAEEKYAQSLILNMYASFGSKADGLAVQGRQKSKLKWWAANIISKVKKVVYLLKTEGFKSTSRKVWMKLTNTPPTLTIPQRNAYQPSEKFDAIKRQAWQPEGVPFISVVLPVYNGEAYLTQTIKSLQAQTLQNAEFIFVDDGSTDHSADLIRTAAAADARIQLVQQENTNAGAARNHGLDHAKGEYVIFLDSDDTFDPDLLALTYDRAISTDAQVVMFDADILMLPEGSKKEPDWMQQTKNLPDGVFAGKDAPQHLFQMLNPWTKLYNRAYIASEGFRYQSQYSTNDAYFTIVALACAQRIATLPRRLVHYHVGHSTNIQANKSRYPLNTYYAFEKAREELNRRHILSFFQSALAIKAAESVIREMDTLKTEESKKELYEVLHAGGLEKLDFALIEQDEFARKYLGNRLERCSSIMKYSWNEHREKHKDRL